MYGLQVFSYEGNEVRTVQKGSNILWVLKDVCGILGIEKYRDAAARLDDDEREPVLVDTLSKTARKSQLNIQLFTARQSAGCFFVITVSEYCS